MTDLRECAFREDAEKKTMVSIIMTDVAPSPWRWYHSRKLGFWGKHSHQETGLTTGTITHDDELATDFSHLHPVKELQSASISNQSRRKGAKKRELIRVCGEGVGSSCRCC